LTAMARRFLVGLGRFLRGKPPPPSPEVDPDSHLGLQDLARFVPVIVPTTLAAAHPNYAIDELGPLPFVVAWTVLAESSWEFIVDEQARDWDQQGFDWRGFAFRNLIRMSETQLDSGKSDERGRPFIRVMLHEDAIGPSRLLLPNRYDDSLGPDYKVAIPERTCAVAYRIDLDETEQADVDGMIDGCFEHGTHPVSPERFDASDFWGLARQYLCNAGDGEAPE
jgi:hypothetical protein